MILEYLNIEQTLNYLQRETDYQYTFNDLKELNYLKSIDVFFFKVCTIYSTRTGGIAHTVQKVKGIFFVEDILFDNKSDDQKFWFRKVFAHVEKIIEHLGYFDNIWQPYQKGNAGLISTSDLVDLEYNEDEEILSYSLQKNLINNVERSDLRFKKSQLDRLIKQSNVSIDELREQVTALIAENDKLKIKSKRQTGKPADAAIDEGQGDTLLILGAVMQCIESVAKSNYTQTNFIDEIIKEYPNTKSISQSTLTKKFSKAKTHLKQNVTP